MARIGRPPIDVSSGTRPCRTCGQVKPLQEFVKDARKTGGVRSRCLECHRARNRDEYEARKPKRRIYLHLPEVRERRRLRRKGKKRTPKPQGRGGIYIFEMNGVYKIGRSKNIPRRLAELRAALPHTVTLAHVIDTDDLVDAEYRIHQLFASKRLNGEWFALTPDDIEQMKAPDEDRSIFIRR